MRISREKAVALIDQKIFQFQVVYNNATFENRHDENYSLAYYGTETLLTEEGMRVKPSKFIWDGKLE